MVADLYLNPHQARTAPPSDYENLLGDAIERCYAAGGHDLGSLVAALNRAAVPPPAGSAWTAELFTAEMARLGR